MSVESVLNLAKHLTTLLVRSERPLFHSLSKNNTEKHTHTEKQNTTCAINPSSNPRLTTAVAADDDDQDAGETTHASSGSSTTKAEEAAGIQQEEEEE